MQLWRAVRVIGGRGGALRPTGLEPPFVGRDRELASIKELFHASAERVEGPPGLGDRRSPARASRACRGSSSSTSTAWPTTSAGTAAAASPTARASPTGRSPRWCGRGRRSPRARIPTPSVAKLHAAVEESIARPRRAPLRRAPAGAPARPRGAARDRPREPLQRVAAVLRAARRRDADGAWSSRTWSGPTRRCSTSSSTWSTGRRTIRSS